MKQRKNLARQFRVYASAGLVAASASIFAWSQESIPPAPAAAPADPTQGAALAGAVRDLQEQVRQLRDAVAEIRSESAAYRTEAAELRTELQTTRTQLAASGALPQPAGEPPAAAVPENANAKPSLEERVASLEDSSQLLSGKVDEQYQTKVESASKYRVRLSGLVLMNLFSNRGTSDNQDFPSYVVEPNSFSQNGDFGATMRQSEIGLEVFGPHLAGARVTGNLQADFSGGFPDTVNGVNSGLFRLRVASVTLDWGRTSVVVGQDNLFLSPHSPTSFASLAVPSLAYAGNLWGWIPQVRIEHRFDIAEGQSLTVQGGLLDNLDGEPPYAQDNRTPQAGERSGQPGYAARVAWTGSIFNRPLTVGTGGYYSRQDWGFDRHMDGWAGTGDWQIALAPRWSWSGEFYRGRAVGGLGGGIGRSVLFDGSLLDPSTQIRGLDSVGGWSQLKFKASEKLEFNGAFGIDSPSAQDVRAFPATESYVDPSLVRNRGALVNFIYRPRSDLLFSTEFRRLRAFDVDGENYGAQQLNMMMGILF